MHKRGHPTDIAGEYQAVFQLADAMHSQFDTDNEKVEKAGVHVLSENELKRRIVKDLKGGSISYKDSLLHSGDARSEMRPWQTRDWVKKEIAWLALLVAAVVVCLLAAWFFPFVVAAYLLPLQVLFAMYVGQSGRSRIVLLVWLVMALSLVPTGVVAGLYGVR